MNEVKTKLLTINVKDLSFKDDKIVDDLVRYISETLPQLNLNRDGNEIEVEMPYELSKRALKLRIKKFLYKKGLNKDYRPISYKSADAEGYAVKEKKILQLSYY